MKRIAQKHSWRPVAVAAALVLAAGAVWAAPAARQAAAGRPIELNDYARIVGVSDPQISPDGARIVCVVSRVNLKDDRHDSQLVLIDVSSGASRPLTFERRGAGTPRWSPKGDRIGFLADAATGKGMKRQVFILPMSGGEAMKITDAPEGVEQFGWSPDGGTIAYATRDPRDQKAIDEHHDSFQMGDDGLFTDFAPTPQHVWLVGADGKGNRRLTSGAWSLPESAPNVGPPPPFSWSPDGRSILIDKRATPHLGDADETTIAVVDAAAGQLRKLTGQEKFEGNAAYSPDGAEVAYHYPRDGNPGNARDVFVAPAAGGDGADVTAGLDRDIGRSQWMPDGKSLLVGASDGTGEALWIQPVGGAARKLALGELEPGAFSVGPNGAIAFVASTPGRASELYYMAGPGDPPRRMTDLNGWMSELGLGRVEGIDWDGPNGLHEDGVVVYPPGFASERKYPLVLVIHGGPTGATTVAFNFFNQLLAAKGFVVFSPNYRGSNNLGTAYQHAIYGDAGDGPGRDVIAGIDVLEKRGFIDTARIGVSGWSYGGYMTTWLIGHYTIWKTAVAGAPVTDFVNQYDWSDNNVERKYIYSGSPWVGENMAKYREQSPITYVGHVRIPVLLLHDVRDPRVSITNSFEFFHALKDNGVPVQMIAFPVAGHFPTDPVHIMDVYRHWSGWMEEHLLPAAAD
ncbi:MAG TPA: S9 family peptidase [Candidatus Acidoferrales bacterium]|nr:S9 family peptidase [Candidatus Acidoferrales bacterium]